MIYFVVHDTLQSAQVAKKQFMYSGGLPNLPSSSNPEKSKMNLHSLPCGRTSFNLDFCTFLWEADILLGLFLASTQTWDLEFSP